MNKDEILKMSRAENEGRHDEREICAFGTASRVGMAVGALVCTLLAFASQIVFDLPEIGLAGWFVYFSMYGASNLVLFRKLNNRRNLFWGIVEFSVAIVFGAALVFKGMV